MVLCFRTRVLARRSIVAGGERAILELTMATHTVEFEKIVKDWIATTKQAKLIALRRLVNWENSQ